MSTTKIYTNEEFRLKYKANQLDLISLPCWLLGVEDDHYLISLEPINRIISNSVVPFSLIDNVEDIGQHPFKGKDETWQYFRHIILYLKKPTTPEGSILFEILLSRQMNTKCGCQSATGVTAINEDTCIERPELDDLHNIIGRILGSGIGCNSYLIAGNRCRTSSRCHAGFRKLENFHNDPSPDNAQQLSGWIDASDMNAQCMRAIIENADVIGWVEFLALIAVVI